MKNRLISILVACLCCFAMLASLAASSFWVQSPALPEGLDAVAYDFAKHIGYSEYMDEITGLQKSEIFIESIGLEGLLSSYYNYKPTKIYPADAKTAVGKGFGFYSEEGASEYWIFPLLLDDEINYFTKFKVSGDEYTNMMSNNEFSSNIFNEIRALINNKNITKNNPLLFFKIKEGYCAITKDGKNAFVLGIEKGYKASQVEKAAFKIFNKGYDDSEESYNVAERIIFDAPAPEKIPSSEIMDALINLIKSKGFQPDGFNVTFTQDNLGGTWNMGPIRNENFDEYGYKAEIYFSARGKTLTDTNISDFVAYYNIINQSGGIELSMASDKANMQGIIADAEAEAKRLFEFKNPVPVNRQGRFLRSPEIPEEAYEAAIQLSMLFTPLMDGYESYGFVEPASSISIPLGGQTNNPMNQRGDYSVGSGFCCYRSDLSKSNTSYIPLFYKGTPMGLAKVDYEKGQYTANVLVGQDIRKRLNAALNDSRVTLNNPLYIYNLGGFVAITEDGKATFYLSSNEKNKSNAINLVKQIHAKRIKGEAPNYKETVLEIPTLYYN